MAKIEVSNVPKNFLYQFQDKSLKDIAAGLYLSNPFNQPCDSSEKSYMDLVYEVENSGNIFFTGSVLRNDEVVAYLYSEGEIPKEAVMALELMVERFNGC